HYCDFHFSTSLKNKDALLNAIKKEINFQNTFFSDIDDNDSLIQSIYFGGGTPSLALDKKELTEILQTIRDNFNVANDIEITLEANPDDLSTNYLTGIFEAGVNRLSVGIQSFDDKDLAFLNRSHTSNQALNCIKESSAIGFNDISVDLIYGIQTSNIDTWKNNLSILSDLYFNHLSCYSLTIEEKTVLHKWIKEGKVNDTNDEKILEQFNYLVDWANQNKYEHYEISNFCKEGAYSKHNTSYWKNNPYLGIGPSAHSYNLKDRYWNVKNNNVYIKQLAEGIIPSEKEILTDENKYNEYVMTGLRTKWGVSLKKLEKDYGSKITTHFLSSAEKLIQQGLIIDKDGIYTITPNGKLISDKIITSLFIA
ncbi:MAG: radical SAM family heme chaperone HemW, partial [Bacteroidia bacterium]|nr:radical SAM family heme chaperone HemW [Bacteroidia bacterium]